MIAEKFIYGVVAIEMALFTCSDFKKAYNKEEPHPLLHIFSAIIELVILAVSLLGLGGHLEGVVL